MRNERKYKIISLVTTILAVLLLGNCVREPFRMATAEYRHHEEYVLKGAKVYSENCVQCHGPVGEGVIGMPLNVSAYQVDSNSPAGTDIYNMLYNTIKMGRKGNDNHYQWEKTADGKWMSYTTMPAWHKSYGGPLDDDYVRALTLFIMKPDGTQWDLVGDGDKAPFAAADLDVDKATGELPLPDAKGVDAATNAAAKALLRNYAKTQCLTCHTIGSKGAKIGPDLTAVGTWGLNEEFLTKWIKTAGSMPHDERMPVYWSANRANAGPQIDLKNKVVSEGPYYMPSFEGKLTDAEINTIVKYLLGLKP